MEDMEALYDDESRGCGAVPRAVYWHYLRSAFGCGSAGLFGATCLLTELLFTASDYWIARWTEAQDGQVGDGDDDGDDVTSGATVDVHVYSAITAG